MNRNYASGQSNSAVYFIGTEVEKTPAHGLKTLFVTGVQPADEIEAVFEQNNCRHIFFGANHSFNPQSNVEWKDWIDLIEYFLNMNILCTVDIPLTLSTDFLETPLSEYRNIVPQLRIPMPYIKLWPYNTMIKIDDVDFDATNPGVWCHSLHEFMSRESFTSWNEYQDDVIIK